jgi:hypothetical protein
MTSSRAILLGAGLIALSVLLSNGTARAVAAGMGPYQLMNHSNTTANVGVFKIDTTTGDVSYCYLTGNADLSCTRSVR